MKPALIVLLLSVTAHAGTEWRTAILRSVNDSESNRVVSNTQTGTVQNVTDVEYRMEVELDGMIYVCSYSPRWRWSYEPNDFIVNDPVQVHLDGKHLILKRPNGKELRTSIVRRARYSSAQKPPAE